MSPGTESIIITLIVGLVIGFLANVIMGPGGLGIIWCIVLGLIGSVVGNYLFALFGISMYGLFGNIVTGVIGACLVIWLARKIRQI